MSSCDLLALSLLTFTTVGALLIWSTVTRKMRQVPKGYWKEIGTVSNLYIYPLKSSRYQSLPVAVTTGKGLKEIRNDDLLVLSDRIFVAFRADTTDFVSGRTFPNFLGITVTSVSSDSVEFAFKGKEPLRVRVPSGFNNEELKMWFGERIPTADCGDEASKWITDVLGVESPVRMGYWSKSISGRREVKNFHKEKAEYYNMKNEYTGSYSDISSYLLINESSVEDINSRLTPGSTPVSHKNFRPNIHISGPTAFAEDKWKWLKIGEKAIFRVFSPCPRCSFVTIDPETMSKDSNMEPLKTLKTFRVATEERQRRIEGSAPFMGVHLGLYQEGVVAVGDSVYISENWI